MHKKLCHIGGIFIEWWMNFDQTNEVKDKHKEPESCALINKFELRYSLLWAYKLTVPWRLGYKCLQLVWGPW